VVTEEIVLRMARTARDLTGSKHLCMAGGVALNCVANGILQREQIFDEIWIQPAAGDAGGALGAALFVSHQLLDQPRNVRRSDSMAGALLGPACDDEEVREYLESLGTPHECIDSEDEFLARVSAELADGKVVGWFQGRMEFGPRSLGSRSILGDARSPEMQAKLNVRIKFRESFRPFAPAVLAEDAPGYFQLTTPSPYMLLVAPVQPEHRRTLSESEQQAMQDPDLRKRVNVPRSTIPAVTHVDYSARIQTVDERNGRFHRLLEEFKRKTGSGVLVNTSFNVRGEPIVCTPEDAVRCFLLTDMDVLAIGRCLLRKEYQPMIDAAERSQHLAAFDLD
jgi:carbamoyltransferase